MEARGCLCGLIEAKAEDNAAERRRELQFHLLLVQAPIACVANFDEEYAQTVAVEFIAFRFVFSVGDNY